MNNTHLCLLRLSIFYNYLILTITNLDTTQIQTNNNNNSTSLTIMLTKLILINTQNSKIKQIIATTTLSILMLESENGTKFYHNSPSARKEGVHCSLSLR